jgi:hypothetical protein
MIRWLRSKLRRRAPKLDPETRRRVHDDTERANWKLWKDRTPPLPRR